MLAFCNFGKYQEYMFPHQPQEIVSIGARAVSPSLCTWRPGVHGLPLVHAQASLLRRRAWPSAHAQPQLSSPCGGARLSLRQETPALRLRRANTAPLNEPEKRECSPTSSHGPSGSCIMHAVHSSEIWSSNLCLSWDREWLRSTLVKNQR